MIRLAPLITADVDTTTLSGGKATDSAQDFLVLLSGALAGETSKSSRWSAIFRTTRNDQIYGSLWMEHSPSSTTNNPHQHH